MTDTASLQPDTILKKLGPSLFAKNFVFHRSLHSTNTVAKELASQGAPEGTIVLAEEQRAGRGRMDRRWLSQGYLNLLFSILLRPPMPPDQVFVLTMILALATIKGVGEISGLKPMIKWPNDLYVHPKKLGGILTEFSAKGKGVEYVVLGLGLNVNWSPDDDEEISNPTTSILAETGLKVSRNDLLIGILKPFETYYRKVLAGEIEDFCKRWNEYSILIGNDVEIESGEETVRGKVLRIDRDGALIIKDDEGKEQKIVSGDVSIKFGEAG
ncbi:MAG: biotin--[acetyl-CoA-carboxylase] ligase [Deltaproteobacteria bacterium]|nr:MAG: biotin--[acetyl-CoA-carboxylase] ligase [Deltaproteobacteria bacterium]